MMCGRKRDAPSVGGERKTLKIFEKWEKSETCSSHLTSCASEQNQDCILGPISFSCEQLCNGSTFCEGDWTLLHSELTPTARATLQCQGFLPIG